jgi:hypothetical protein
MSERKQLCVYTHSANGTVFYVGQGTRFRPRDRNNRSRAWRDHVEAAGGYDINIAHWTDDRGDAVRVESELIAAHPTALNVEKYDRRRFPESVGVARKEIRLSPSQTAAIDEWRRHQTDLPPRAEAIVRLIEIGLAAGAKKKAKPETKK